MTTLVQLPARTAVARDTPLHELTANNHAATAILLVVDDMDAKLALAGTHAQVFARFRQWLRGCGIADTASTTLADLVQQTRGDLLELFHYDVHFVNTTVTSR